MSRPQHTFRSVPVSVLIFGERLGGKVDRVPGLFYVGTMFFHVDYIPLIPLRSYIIFQGTEQGEAFQGKQIKLSGRSVLAGLLRGWLGLATIIAAAIAGFALTSLALGEIAPGFVAPLVATAAICGAFFFVLVSSKRSVYLVLAGLIAASLTAWFACQYAVKENPAFGVIHEGNLSQLPTLLIANLAAFLYTLTRLFDRASYDRALRMADELGLERNVIEAIYTVDPNAPMPGEEHAVDPWAANIGQADMARFG
jgi:hypothetical protein